ncbi:MAG: ankyrin repeat domain-containing protein [Planctomycetaceae bacterium]
MNRAQTAAFELRLDDLRSLAASGHDLNGCLLAACSAHEPDAERQAAVIRFLANSGVSVQETDKNGVTPLHRAVRFRSPAAVSLLLELGADVNATDRKSQSTPLHRAVTNTGAPSTAGKSNVAVEIARMLIAHGADVGAKNRVGKTPVDYVNDAAMSVVLTRKTG